MLLIKSIVNAYNKFQLVCFRREITAFLYSSSNSRRAFLSCSSTFCLKIQLLFPEVQLLLFNDNFFAYLSASTSIADCFEARCLRFLKG